MKHSTWHFSLVAVFTLLFLGGCGGGNRTPTLTGNQAMLGPLSDATVNVFDLADRENSLATATTDTKGGFDLGDLNHLNDEKFYLVAVSGGSDIDADDNGLLDETPTENSGTLHGLASGATIKKKELKITAISDMAWWYTESQLNDLSNNDIKRRLDDIAKILFREDSSNSDIDANDLLTFVPHNSSYKDKLTFDYAKFFEKDEDSISMMDALHQNKPTRLKEMLGKKFATQLSFKSRKDLRSTDVKIKVSPMGHGSYSASSGEISYDSDLDKESHILSDFYPKNAEEKIIITAVPKDETEIDGWKGCPEVSADKTQCTIPQNADHEIIVWFRDKNPELNDNVTMVNLVSQEVEIDASGNAHIVLGERLNGIADDAIAEMSDLTVGHFIVGDSNGGFLAKVTAINKISDHEYRLETTPALITDVLKRGSGRSEKQMTQSHLASNVLTSTAPNAKSMNPHAKQSFRNSKIPAQSFTAIDGVAFIPSADPSDTNFKIRFGINPVNDGTGNTQAAEKVTGEVSLEAENERGDTVKATISGDLDVKIHIDASLSVSPVFAFPPVQLDYLSFVPNIEIDSGLKITIEGEAKFDKEIEIGRLDFETYIFQAGPLPVAITPRVTLYLGATGEVKAEITTSVKAGVYAAVGFAYNRRSGAELITTINPTFTFNPPSGKVSASFEAYTKVGAALLFYGSFGPEVTTKGYGKLATEALASSALARYGCSGFGTKTTGSVGMGIDFRLKLDSKFESILPDGLTEEEPLKSLLDGTSIYTTDYEFFTLTTGDASKCDALNVPNLVVVEPSNLYEKEVSLDNATTRRNFEYTLKNMGNKSMEVDINWDASGNKIVIEGIIPDTNDSDFAGLNLIIPPESSKNVRFDVAIDPGYGKSTMNFHFRNATNDKGNRTSTAIHERVDGPGCIVYEHTSYRGAELTLKRNQSISDLDDFPMTSGIFGHDWNNEISSAKVPE